MSPHGEVFELRDDGVSFHWGGLTLPPEESAGLRELVNVSKTIAPGLDRGRISTSMARGPGPNGGIELQVAYNGTVFLKAQFYAGASAALFISSLFAFLASANLKHGADEARAVEKMTPIGLPFIEQFDRCSAAAQSIGVSAFTTEKLITDTYAQIAQAGRERLEEIERMVNEDKERRRGKQTPD